MKVAVIGRTKTLYRAARRVADSDHDVSVVATAAAEPHYEVAAADFEALAEQTGAEFHRDEPIDSPALMETFETCDVAISVNWKTLIPGEVIDAFRHGIINAHTGDLPRYRGNAATNWAIINGEDEIVFTLHFMTTELDSGPILTQRSMEMGNGTTIKDVYEFGYDNYPEMFLSVVDGLEQSTIEPEPQSTDSAKALRCYPRRPEDSRLEWAEPAEHLDRIIRASSDPLFGAYTFYNGDKLRVWEAHVTDPPTPYLGTPGQVAHRRPETGCVEVITGDRFLSLETVQIEGEERSDATAVITSNKNRLGLDVTDLW